jgi:hypothetical protein
VPRRALRKLLKLAGSMEKIAVNFAVFTHAKGLKKEMLKYLSRVGTFKILVKQLFGKSAMKFDNLSK